ncbi:hypothetical protein BJY04DRAFT_220957 [Aspergillus karnatakaensis]|uniref:extracellular serine rich protein n=1 Tax=Aspergillus karnatakaensis TaxID=1810916 RepID=UPI003CCD9761
MHYTPLTLSLLGTLALTLTPTFADKEADLGYMKCASAVVQTTSFPACTSTYKLDCYCEAQAQIQKQAHIDENGNTNLNLENIGTARVQLSPEVEAFCVENGVPKDEIARYLCDDDAVPVSPRRGSTPMVKFGGTAAYRQSYTETYEEGPREDEKEEEGCDDDESGTATSKRAVLPENTRLLIPENEETATSDRDTKTEVETHPNPEIQETNEDNDKDDRGERIATANAVYQVVTVTETKTECSCATPAPSAKVESNESDKDLLPGTAVSAPETVATATETETDIETSASASVRVASSSVVTAGVVPTAVDAEHAFNDDNHEADVKDEEEVDDPILFEGCAISHMVSRGVIVGVLGVVAGVAML